MKRAREQLSKVSTNTCAVWSNRSKAIEAENESSSDAVAGTEHPASMGDETGPEIAGRSGEDETDLIDAVRRGEAEALEILYARYRPSGLGFAARLLRKSYDAEDALQEAFVKAVGAIRAGYGPKDSFGSYLYTAIRSVAATHWRKLGREQPAFGDTLGPEKSYRDAGLDRALILQEQERIAEAMRMLPERWRTVLWYREVLGELPRTIAPLMGLTPNGVSALLKRARAGLRTAYIALEVQEASQRHSTGPNTS